MCKEIINKKENSVIEYYDPMDYITELPIFAKSLSESIEECINKTKNLLATTPAILNFIKSIIPEKAYQAIISSEDNAKILSGALELVNKTDGTFMAMLRDPKTKEFVKQIPLSEFPITPNLTSSLISLTNQLQMAKVISLIEDVQQDVGKVLQGQVNDRLAEALSCQQKFLQAIRIKNEKLKTDMLIRIAMDAEDVRNKLMLNQKDNLMFIYKQPKNAFMKMISGADIKKIDKKMNEIRKDLQAINLTSIIGVIVYNELGEIEASKESLKYYSEYINNNILKVDGLIDRLDSLEDVKMEKFWSNGLTKISNTINKLENQILLLDNKEEKND